MYSKSHLVSFPWLHSINPINSKLAKQRVPQYYISVLKDPVLKDVWVFFHWIDQTFGRSGNLFTEEILYVGISLVNRVPDLYFYIAYCWTLCWKVGLQITSSFQLSECHFYYGQLVISFRSKWNSLRSKFDRTVNLFHALIQRNKIFRKKEYPTWFGSKDEELISCLNGFV